MERDSCATKTMAWWRDEVTLGECAAKDERDCVANGQARSRCVERLRGIRWKRLRSEGGMRRGRSNNGCVVAMARLRGMQRQATVVR